MTLMMSEGGFDRVRRPQDGEEDDGFAVWDLSEKAYELLIVLRALLKVVVFTPKGERGRYIGIGFVVARSWSDDAMIACRALAIALAGIA